MQTLANAVRYFLELNPANNRRQAVAEDTAKLFFNELPLANPIRRRKSCPRRTDDPFIILQRTHKRFIRTLESNRLENDVANEPEQFLELAQSMAATAAKWLESLQTSVEKSADFDSRGCDKMSLGLIQGERVTFCHTPQRESLEGTQTPAATADRCGAPKPGERAKGSVPPCAPSCESELGTQGGHCVAGLSDALQTLSDFAALGCDTFQVLFKDDASDKKICDETVSAKDLDSRLADYLKKNQTSNLSLIVRPFFGDGQHYINVDEASPLVVELLEPFAFQIAETSPDNYHVRIMLDEDYSADEAYEIRFRLFETLKDLNANSGGNGAFRLPGSVNQKSRHDGFRVRLLKSSDVAHYATRAELEAAGLLKEKERAPRESAIAASVCVPQGKQKMPRYEVKYFREDAPTKPDRSRNDARFVNIAIQRGFSESEIINELMQHSEKAKGRRDSYGYCQDTYDYCLRNA